MFPYLYAHEKLTTAVRILATGEGDVRSRLLPAFYEFQTLQARDLPQELQEDYAWVIKELTKREPKTQWDFSEWNTDGSVQFNLRRMKNQTGRQIAKRICDLQYRIQSAYEEYRV